MSAVTIGTGQTLSKGGAVLEASNGDLFAIFMQISIPLQD
jgi:hypothetical protein